MGWRQVVISKESKLSVRNSQLVIAQKSIVSIPLEDIVCIFLESNRITVTSALLSKISEYNIALFTLDDHYMPNGVLVGFQPHSRGSKVLNLQLGLSKPFKKQVWKCIVEQKIRNQAKVLNVVHQKGADILFSISQNVESGDKSNREAYAAKMYFKELFGLSFKRREECDVNAMLNYGYAVLRGCIAREVVSFGFMPSLGIFHQSELNAFNLVDDFIEPYRQVVDLLVASFVNDGEKFTKTVRYQLINCLNLEVLVGDRVHSVQNAIHETVKSFSIAAEKQDAKRVVLPEMLKNNGHAYE